LFRLTPNAFSPTEPSARSQAGIVFSLVLVVSYADQLTKAWAWRHLSQVHVNSGGDLLVGPSVSNWFRDRTTGAACDVLDAALLLAAGALLLSRRRSPLTLCGATLALAGWASNLGDRLGMHFWTAPGSMRGVVDFVPWDGRYWNLADAAIAAGTALFTLSLASAALRAVMLRRTWRRWSGVDLRRPFADKWPLPVAGFAFAATAILAAVGAIAYSGVSSPAVLASGGG
jgi:lipoprotein signal peptidase